MTDYKNGKGHEDRQSNSGKYELVNLNSISIDGGLKHSGKFVDDAADTLLENDLVMVLSDVGHGDLLGRVALIPEDDRFVLNQRVALLRPNDTVDPQFLFSCINAHQQYFKSQGAGMSQLNISKGSVENFTSYVPHKEEQFKIGKLFSNLDNLITLHQRKYDKLIFLKKSMLEKMFPQKGEKIPEVRFSGFNNDWEQRKFSEIVTRVTTTSNEGGLPRVEYEDINSGRGTLNKNIFEKNSIKKGILFQENDVLYGKLRPYLKNWIFPAFSGIAVGDFWLLRGERTDSTYVYSLIQSRAFDEVSNQSTGTKMPRADWSLVANTIFPLPNSKQEQHQIGNLFLQLDNLITLHQRKVEKLKIVKKSMLEKMFV